MSGAPRVAVVGAGTLIGAVVLEQLRAQALPLAELHALDEPRALVRERARDALDEGEEPGEGPALADVERFDFARIDLAIFCGRAALSERYAEAVARTAWVIDGSDRFRERDEVPLVAADVNPEALAGFGPAGLIALPSSASVALATALAPLDRLRALERVEVTTLHAVSGQGRAAVDELAAQTVALLNGRPARSRGAAPIAFNVIPQVGELGSDGASREERHLAFETARLLGREGLAVNATAVRVPVFFGHSLVVHASFTGPIDPTAAAQVLQCGTGLALIESASDAGFPTPATFASAPDRVYVGRLRTDGTRDRALNFWVVADNVRKCAAHNAVSVAQILVNLHRRI